MIDPQDICFCYLADAYHCDVYGCINDPLDQYIKQFVIIVTEDFPDPEIPPERQPVLFRWVFYPVGKRQSARDS